MMLLGTWDHDVARDVGPIGQNSSLFTLLLK